MIAYYGELCTKIYESDKSLADGKELEFYLSFVKDRGMKVLEPMCGNGRMLIPLMQHGIDIDGFDVSEEMLKVCKGKAEILNLAPKVFHERIEEFHSDKKYDLIIIPFGSFSLLPDHLVNKSLQNLKDVLTDGGKLLLKIVAKNSETEEFPDWQETNRKNFDGETIVEYRKISYNDETKILNVQLKYDSIQGEDIEKTELMDFPIRLYYPGEFEEVLKANSFNQIVIHEVNNGYGEGSSFFSI